jgi:hypothetical protein
MLFMLFMFVVALPGGEIPTVGTGATLISLGSHTFPTLGIRLLTLDKLVICDDTVLFLVLEMVLEAVGWRDMLLLLVLLLLLLLAAVTALNVNESPDIRDWTGTTNPLVSGRWIAWS